MSNSEDLINIAPVRRPSVARSVPMGERERHSRDFANHLAFSLPPSTVVHYLINRDVQIRLGFFFFAFILHGRTTIPSDIVTLRSPCLYKTVTCCQVK